MSSGKERKTPQHAGPRKASRVPSLPTITAMVPDRYESWFCDQCKVEVYERRCPHCGKTKRESK